MYFYFFALLLLSYIIIYWILRFVFTENCIQEIRYFKEEIIENIEKFITVCSHQNEDECVICMEDFKKNIAYKIKCPCQSNVYHKSCLLKWFEKECSCPVCRKNICEKIY